MTAQFDDSACPRSAPGLGEQLIDGEAVIVNAQGGEILVLNACGATVWQMLDGTTDVATIVARIREEFDVGEEQAGQDVRAFLSELARRNALA